MKTLVYLRSAKRIIAAYFDNTLEMLGSDLSFERVWIENDLKPDCVQIWDIDFHQVKRSSKYIPAFLSDLSDEAILVKHEDVA